MDKAFLDLVASRRSFLLTGHEHPDGDCLGSQIAFYHLLRSLGKEVQIINPDPLSKSLDFLSEHTPTGVYRAGDELPEVDVVCLLDCAYLGRTGSMAEPIAKRIDESGTILAVIDHHIGSENGDGTVCFVDSEASATGALVHELFSLLGVAIDPIAAQGVFLSLVSDTGWFRYSNTDHRVLSIA